MNDSTREQHATPPYVAYRTFKNFLRSLAAHMPGRIDKSVMPSMSGGAQAQLLYALKYLGLIDQNGVPTDKFIFLVKADGQEYQKTLREILDAAYPFLRGSGLRLEAATAHQLDEQFKHLATGDTVRKCLAFFIPAVTDAGITLSPYIKQPRRRGNSTGKQRKQRSPSNTDIQYSPANNGMVNRSAQSWHELLLAKFPTFDPEWPDQVKERWFESFGKLMQQGQGQKEKSS